MGKIKKMACLLFMILFLVSPAYGEMLNGTQAADAAVTYAAGEEEAWAHGPYYYQSHPYYYIQFMTGDNLTGVLILDAENGELIKEADTIEKISYTVWYLNNVTPEIIPAYNVTIDTYQKSAIRLNETAKALEQEARFMTEGDKKRVNDAAEAYKNMAVLIEEYADMLSNTIPIMEDIISGNRSYENAVKLAEENDKVEKVIIKMDPAYDNVIENMNMYYDILIEKSSTYRLNKTLTQDYKTTFNNVWTQEKSMVIADGLDAFKEDRQTVKDNQERDIRLAEERNKTAEAPGFGILIAISAVLIVCLIINRKVQ